MKFYFGYFYIKIIFFPNRGLGMDINMYVLKTVHMLVLCVKRI